MKRAAPLAALLLAACIDFVEVTDPSGGGQSTDGIPASAVITIRSMARGEANHVTIDGQLIPGVDTRLQVRAVASDTLWVMERSLLPWRTEPDATRYYREEWKRGLDDSLTVRLPRIHDLSGELPVIRWFPSRSLDSDTLLLERGQDLVLHLRPTSPGADSSRHRTVWSFSVPSGEGQLRIDMVAPLPALLRIPWAMLPPPDGGVLRPMLHIQEMQEHVVPGGDYLIQAALDIELSWTVRVVEEVR